jgi:1,3-beta-glucanosyltransferase GAS3
VQAPACATKLIKGDEGFTSNFTLPVLPETSQLIRNGVRPAPVGRIVAISDYSVKSVVRNPDGSSVTGLAVKPLADNASNTPGTNAGAGGNGGSGGGDKNAAARPSSSFGVIVVVGAATAGINLLAMAGLIY